MIEPSSLALIGYRGTGKSTVAPALAQRLGWDWVDADAEAERRAGKSIAAIFSEQGEAVFRELESQVVRDLCRRTRIVIALGGGAVLRQDNRQAIAACGAVAWLSASVDSILERQASDPGTASRRPNLTSLGGRREIEGLLAERTPLYRACATLEVDSEGKSPAEIAGEILTRLGLEP